MVSHATLSLRRWLFLGDTLLGLFDVLRLGRDYLKLSLGNVSLAMALLEGSQGLG